MRKIISRKRTVRPPEDREFDQFDRTRRRRVRSDRTRRYDDDGFNQPPRDRDQDRSSSKKPQKEE